MATSAARARAYAALPAPAPEAPLGPRTFT